MTESDEGKRPQIPMKLVVENDPMDNVPLVHFWQDQQVIDILNKYDVDFTVHVLEKVKERLKALTSGHNRRRQLVLEDIKELKSTKDSVLMLKNRKPGASHPCSVQLDEKVKALIELPETDVVQLWLGSDVLMELTLDEAQNLLDKRLKLQEEKSEVMFEELLKLHDSFVHADVNSSRVESLRRSRIQRASMDLKDTRKITDSSIVVEN